MDSTEAGTECFRDRLDSETLLVQLHGPNSLRLGQWLATHLHAAIVEQLEHAWLRDAEAFGQFRRANARLVQLYQLRDLLVAEAPADEPRATRFVQVIDEVCRHDCCEFSQLLQFF
ncbi:hypothetical protein ASE56_14900 [Microbacterium sp. Leaf203]|nr:hypothetical protein ASE56_14900 [Microbacterium sp. Leaf203]